MQIHQFDPIIYPRKLWIITQFSKKLIDDNFTHDYNINFNTSNAFVIHANLKENNNGGGLIVFNTKKQMTVQNITHECVHFASLVFDYCGLSMGFNEGKDEHFAYLAGWAAKCCWEVKLNKQ